MDKRHHRVAQVGMGPIGAEVVRVVLQKPWLELVSVVDIDPEKIGRDVGEILGLGHEIGVRVEGTLSGNPEVVCHSTRSRLSDVQDEILALLGQGCHVVSTCEELAFPLDHDVREAFQRASHAANRSLLGTGVNPGFVLDKLALTLSAVCQRIDSVRARRTVDAATRREPLQRKIGAGLTREEFRVGVDSGRIRHMGLRESIHLLASGLNLAIESEASETIEPVIAEQEVSTEFITVPAGCVAGVHQTISARSVDGVTLDLDLSMYVGASHAADELTIRGIPNVSMAIEGGIHGDRATAAIVVNAIPRIIDARPGVLTMDDISISYH